MTHPGVGPTALAYVLQATRDRRWPTSIAKEACACPLIEALEIARKLCAKFFFLRQLGQSASPRLLW